MEKRAARNPQTMIAIDVESAPDPKALDLLGGRRGRTTRNVATHMITAAAWLIIAEGAAGDWSVDQMDSVKGDEFDILLALDTVLEEGVRRSAEIVTYNGDRHDHPLIRRRAERHRLFDLPGLFPAEQPRRRDVMRQVSLGIGDWPQLREACAGLGFSCDADDDPLGFGHRLSARRRKAETDVTGTILVRLHELAANRRDVETLALSWSALGAFIHQRRARLPHLLQFTGGIELDALVDRLRPGAPRASG